MSDLPTYQISKVVLGSFNQANEELFGQTAGTQCSVNCLYAIFWSNFRRVNVWKTIDLDKILIEGDKLYKQLDTNRHLSVDDMPRFIEINGVITDFNFLNFANGEATLVNDYPFLQIPLSESENLEFNALMIINGFTIAIMSRPQGYFIFDSHSRNELGLLDPSKGKSCLLKFDNIFELEKYVQYFYLKEMEKESTYFEIQFIQVSELKEELKETLQKDFSTFMRNSTKKRKSDVHDGSNSSKRKKFDQTYYKKNKEAIIENSKTYRSQNKEKISEKKKTYRSQNKEKINEQDRVYYQKNKERVSATKKSHYEKNIAASNKKRKNKQNDLVSKFLKLIYEGPFYICVCCNRCLYRKTVVKYSPEKYDMPQEYYYS